VLQDVHLERNHIEHILHTLQADAVVDTHNGGKLRMRAYLSSTRHLFPYAGAGGVGAVLGICGEPEEEEEDEEMRSEGAPMHITRVLRVGGRSDAMIGVGAGLAARARRSAALSALGEAGFTDWDNGDYVPAEEVRRSSVAEKKKRTTAASKAAAAAAATAAAASAAAASAAHKAGSKGKSKAIRYDREAEEDEGEGGEEEEDEEDEDEDEDGLDEADPRYRVVRPGAGVNGFAMSPCGVCPVLDKCTPSGLISPATCVYFSAWLCF
jgi:hypothetical protein